MADWGYELFWKETLNQMLEELGEQEFNRWFTLVEYRGAVENSITLGVPSTFYREEVKRRYKSSIEEKLKQIADKDISLLFEIIEIKPQKTAQKKAAASKEAPPKSSKTGQVKEAPIPEKKPHPQLNLRYNFDAYVIGDNNSFAANAAIAIAKNPGTAYNPLFLYGGVGFGKTHLTQAIGNYVYANSDSKIIYVAAETFLNEYVQAIGERKMPTFKNKYREVDVFLMDDIHLLQGKAGVQEELFHTFNALYEANKQIVFTCDRPASELKNIEDRLKNRFERGLNIDLQPPNYEIRFAILKKKVESGKIAIPDEVISLISKNVSSNVRDLEAALTKLIAYADLAGKTITVEVAQQQLKDVFSSPKQTNMSIDIIQKVIAEYYKVSTSDLKGKKRSQKVIVPRQLAIFISHEITEYSYTEIGQAFGRDHSTVLYSCRQVKDKIQADPSLESTIQKFIRMIKEYSAKV
jgi:chromosomal replication initiator protein